MESHTASQLYDPARNGHKFLCYFLHRLLDYRLAEVESLACLFGCTDLKWTMPYGDVEASPLWYISLPDIDIAKKIGSRMLLAKGIFEVWGEGSDWDELQASIEAYPQELKEPYLGPDIAFKVVVDTYGHSMTMQQQLESIERLAFIPFEGRVDLRNPDQRFWLIIADNHGSGGLEKVPYRLYFAREVAVADRSPLHQFSLRSRSYLGPTSMDNEMALLMCNMGKVTKHQLVLDPYAGTGSILVAAASCGARVMGSDIDVRVLRDGKMGASGEPVDVASNFQQYGLEQPVGLVMMDTHRPAFRDDLCEVLDAVIGDPPYGVRAGGKKSVARDITIQDRATHIPSMAPYTLGECIRDLLDLSARLLKIGGRVVYFLPATPDTYEEADVPSHPALKIVHNCEQILTTRYTRRLVVMEKTVPYDRQVAMKHHEDCGDPTLPIDNIHDIVFEKNKDEMGNTLGTERPFNARRFRGKHV